MRHTQGQYQSLQHAYNWFNRTLFDNQLPEVLITLQRSSVAYGWFGADKFSNRSDADERIDEIALNPQAMHGRSDTEILSTLVHEMAHAWQSHFGDPSRAGYHNEQWASLMESIGLIPTDTGAPGGKRTGQKMSHYIDEGGEFLRVCTQWLARHPKGIQWEIYDVISRPGEEGSDAEGDGKGGENGDDSKTKKRASKTKYTCPICGQNAWAKPDAHLMCGDHLGQDFLPREITMKPGGGR